MSDPLFEQDDAATPLAPEERENLIPSYITLRRELNGVEQANISAAGEWALARKRDVHTEPLPYQQPATQPPHSTRLIVIERLQLHHVHRQIPG